MLNHQNTLNWNYLYRLLKSVALKCRLYDLYFPQTVKLDSFYGSITVVLSH